MHELRQDPAHAEYMKLIGWKVEKSAAGIYAYIRPMPLTGTCVMKIQRVPWKLLDLTWVKLLSKKYRVITTYIEVDERVNLPVTQKPDTYLISKVHDPVTLEMKKRGYKTLTLGMVASKTQVIDISENEETLLKKMKPKTRYNIGLAQRRGLQTRIWTGAELKKGDEILETYLKLIKKNNQRVHYWGGRESWVLAQLKAFRQNAYIVAAIDHKNSWLAAALFLTANQTSYYAHNGSTKQGRIDMAPSGVVWAGIKEAKIRGLKYLDFDGVYDERYPLKRWQGYTRFKQGFGGEYVWYPPAFEKWFTWWR